MTETDLITALRAALIPRLPDVAIVQGWQPQSSGTPGGPTLTLYSVSEVDYGWPERRAVWDPATEVFDDVEVQQRETTFQVNALIPSVAPGSETAAELLARCRTWLRSSPVLRALRTSGLSILRVRDIRRGYVEGDGGQPESNPSFDVTVRHSDILTLTTPAVTSTAIIIERA